MKLFSSSIVTVLLVEDEVLSRVNVAEALSENGMTVLEAANAAEALAHLENTSDISVLVTDIDLPGAIDGIELARMVRKNLPKTRIIFMSGAVLPSSDDQINGAQFVQKPCSIEELLEVIKSR